MHNPDSIIGTPAHHGRIDINEIHGAAATDLAEAVGSLVWVASPQGTYAARMTPQRARQLLANGSRVSLPVACSIPGGSKRS